MGSSRIEQGDVARAVAANVRAIRDRRGLSQQQLASRIVELGRSMRPSGIAKIEAGDRRVDVDDLVSLAVALNVTPARLLVPDVSAEDEVNVAPNYRVTARRFWDWAIGEEPIQPREHDVRSGDPDSPLPSRALVDDALERPTWYRGNDRPLVIECRKLLRLATAFAFSRNAVQDDDTAYMRWLKRTNNAIESVQDEVYELKVQLLGEGESDGKR